MRSSRPIPWVCVVVAACGTPPEGAEPPGSTPQRTGADTAAAAADATCPCFTAAELVEWHRANTTAVSCSRTVDGRVYVGSSEQYTTGVLMQASGEADGQPLYVNLGAWLRYGPGEPEETYCGWVVERGGSGEVPISGQLGIAVDEVQACMDAVAEASEALIGVPCALP